MHLPQVLPPSTAPLLEVLRCEEELLTESRAAAVGQYEALRAGNLDAIATTSAGQEKLAISLSEAESRRLAATHQLAASLGFPPEGVTLAALASVLPEPQASELLAARTRLSALTKELAHLQRRNANLIGHLRSYFRGVLFTLTTADSPVRYGPSGSWLAPASGGAVQVRG